MKEIIISALLLLISFGSFSQQANSKPAITQKDYLTKSRNAKEEGILLFIVGSAFVIIPTIGAINNEMCYTCAEKPFPVVPAVIGAGMVVGSIVLFNRSNHLKRQAMSLSFKNETFPQIVASNIVSRPLPFLSLKIGL
jgi:hypothetical protein